MIKKETYLHGKHLAAKSVKYLKNERLIDHWQASLNWGKKDEPVYVTEESGVVGLNFHQSKEVLIHDTTNGIGSHYDVRSSALYAPSLFDFGAPLLFACPP